MSGIAGWARRQKFQIMTNATLAASSNTDTAAIPDTAGKAIVGIDFYLLGEAADATLITDVQFRAILPDSTIEQAEGTGTFLGVTIDEGNYGQPVNQGVLVQIYPKNNAYRPFYFDSLKFIVATTAAHNNVNAWAIVYYAE